MRLSIRMRVFLFGALSLVLLALALKSGSPAWAVQSGQVQIAELKGVVYADGGYRQILTNASQGFTSNFDASGYGSFGWQFTNTTGATLRNVKLVVFLDADLDRDTTTFFNEYGALVNLSLLSQAAPGDIAPSGWEIDEPGFLFGDFARHQSNGAFDNANSVPANAPDDVALALSFQIGSLTPNSPIKSFFFISASNIGGLSQTDNDANTKIYFNGYVNLNNPPTITASTITRQQGGPPASAGIATVSDDITPAGNLVVTVTTPAAGVVVNNITNSNGAITADVSAACNATTGARSVGLTVTDGSGLTATANLIVNVTANTPPALAAYPATGVGLGGGAIVTPVAAHADNGSITNLSVSIAPGGFTGAVTINQTTGAVTITNAAPVGSYTVTVTARDNCGAISTRTFPLAVNRVQASIAATSGCVSKGSILTVNAQVTSGAGASQGFEFTAAMSPQLVALVGACVTSAGSCSVTPNAVRVAGSIGAGQSVNVSFKVQVKDDVATGARFCINSNGRFDINNDGAYDSLHSVEACSATNCPSAGPGTELAAGSVLIFNLHASNPANQNSEDTRINLTNTDPARMARVHLFFVDGVACSVADSYICLTPNQTASFLTSDLDPGTTGYIIAVAVDAQGCPTHFNYLIGDEYVKLSGGHAANLPAEAISAIAGAPPACDKSSTTATLKFDGVSYQMLPRMLAVDNLPSRAGGNDTLLVLNRISGNLSGSVDTLGSISGILYNDTETGYSFGFSGGCQLRSTLNNNFPRTTPRYDQVIPAGRSGWMKLWTSADTAILGAMINFNPNTATSSGAFNQGHNLHKLRLTAAASLTIPVIPPNC